jgi:glycerophosphoryl diester phosphodiesterase
MGANAVEIDVQLSKDGTAFLYHDEDFNSRLTTGAFCLGNVSNYTMLMIKLFCRLKHEEYIPTLREAMARPEKYRRAAADGYPR